MGNTFFLLGDGSGGAHRRRRQRERERANRGQRRRDAIRSNTLGTVSDVSFRTCDFDADRTEILPAADAEIPSLRRAVHPF